MSTIIKFVIFVVSIMSNIINFVIIIIMSTINYFVIIVMSIIINIVIITVVVVIIAITLPSFPATIITFIPTSSIPISIPPSPPSPPPPSPPLSWPASRITVAVEYSASITTATPGRTMGQEAQYGRKSLWDGR
jgi:hypothetical protein